LQFSLHFSIDGRRVSHLANLGIDRCVR
jgi:hypothetical protein